MALTTRELTTDKLTDFMNFMSTLVGKEHSVHSAQTLRTLFNWNNDIHPFNRESVITCASCRNKVWNRCYTYYLTNETIQISKQITADLEKQTAQSIVDEEATLAMKQLIDFKEGVSYNRTPDETKPKVDKRFKKNKTK